MNTVPDLGVGVASGVGVGVGAGVAVGAAVAVGAGVAVGASPPRPQAAAKAVTPKSTTYNEAPTIALIRRPPFRFVVI